MSCSQAGPLSFLYLPDTSSSRTDLKVEGGKFQNLERKLSLNWKGPLNGEGWFPRGPAKRTMFRGLVPAVAETGGAISDHFSTSSLGLWRSARLPLWPLQSLLETSSWHAGFWPALPPLFIEALGWEPGLLRAFLWPAPITSLRRFSAKLWLKLGRERENGGGEGMGAVNKATPVGPGRTILLEQHGAGAVWALALSKGVGRKVLRGLLLLCALPGLYFMRPKTLP